jgi:hypothetical protein
MLPRIGILSHIAFLLTVSSPSSHAVLHTKRDYSRLHLVPLQFSHGALVAPLSLPRSIRALSRTTQSNNLTPLLNPYIPHHNTLSPSPSSSRFVSFRFVSFRFVSSPSTFPISYHLPFRFPRKSSRSQIISAYVKCVAPIPRSRSARTRFPFGVPLNYGDER